MRHKRAKAARKTLRFFSLNGGIKPPFRVLLDGTFLVASVRQKLSLQERLKRVLQGEKMTLYTTRSVLDELHSLLNNNSNKDNESSPFAQARQLGLDECTILESDSIPDTVVCRKKNHTVDVKHNEILFNKLGNAGADIYKLASNSQQHTKKYIIATQDESLSNELRKIPCTPIIRISRAVLILEAPSVSVKKQANRDENKKLISAGGTITAEEQGYITKVKQHERKLRKRKREEDEQRLKKNRMKMMGSEPGRIDFTNGRKKRRAKEPNPLSCKKKSVKNATTSTNESASKKSRRRKKTMKTND